MMTAHANAAHVDFERVPANGLKSGSAVGHAGGKGGKTGGLKGRTQINMSRSLFVILGAAKNPAGFALASRVAKILLDSSLRSE
jgi:hypothetical protein